MIAIVPRVLGALFYYSPEQTEAQNALRDFAQLPQSFAWRDPQKIEALVNSLPPMNDGIAHDFSILFEGQGKMPAPPWGSVYLSVDNIVMGASTLRYRQFLETLNLTLVSKLNEPEDQFGLMLFALAKLLEKENDTATIQLLEEYLLPWCFRYLSLVVEYDLSNHFYSVIAQIAAIFLEDLNVLLELTPNKLALRY
jgi:TorA maturation chaperone TorD